MAAVILSIVLSLTVTKTLMVVDAVFWPADGGLFASARQYIRSHDHTIAASTVGSPRQRPKGPASAGASKVR